MPNNSAVPPTVLPIPSHREMHGVTLIDEYSWMRDADDPRLLAYLRAERAHYDRATGHLKSFREQLFSEVEHRLLPTDESVRWKRGDQFYYTKTVTGSDYEQFLSSRYLAGPGRVLLDEADLAAEPKGYVDVIMHEISPDNRLLGYAFDTDGDEFYTLRFRDTVTGQDLPDTVDGVFQDAAWSADSTWFFYTRLDPLFRVHQIWRHRLGTESDRDVLVLDERDARFDLSLRASRSGRYILIHSANRDTTEAWYIPADRPTEEPRSVGGRRPAVEYHIDHCREPDEFLIVTDLGAPEYRLMAAPVNAPGEWRELFPSRPGERLTACHAVAGHLVLDLRRDGERLLRVVDRAADGTPGAEREVTAGIPAGHLDLVDEFEYDEPRVLVAIESLVEPNAWYDVDLATGARELRKRREVPGYDPAGYRTETRYAPAPDGALVPVSLAWRADTPLDGTAPCLMWGYGAYESCDDPEFDPLVVSLLDRGVVYALTHPRGGGEKGRAWWLGGRMASKMNTFTDYLAVANWLAGAAPDATGGSGPGALVDGARIATRGLSAGGLLQGAIAFLAPARWAAIVAEVPFVDVINTMLDPDTPLTINEWEEWGDPRRPEDFAWMLAYSPYDNLPASPRPPLLVTGAVNDARVMVKEPAKWVARLRATAAPGDETLFRVELGAGAHTGPTGRYAHFAYEAEVCAFVLSRLGVPVSR